MTQEDIIKYKSLYLQTSWGYLNMLRKSIAFLIQGSQARPVLNSAHLAAHSLKSQSILMGYNQIGELSKILEGIFKAENKNINVTDKIALEIILKALAKVQLSLTQISENGKEIDMSEEINKLKSL